MASGRKYYVLENGQYVVRYKDTQQEPLTSKFCQDNQQELAVNEKMFTPKPSRKNYSSRFEVQPFSTRREVLPTRFYENENMEGERSKNYNTGKYSEQRCYNDDARVSILEEQLKNLIYENKHLANKAAYHLEKYTQAADRILHLEEEVEGYRSANQEQVRMYNEVCVAYEILVEENRNLQEDGLAEMRQSVPLKRKQEEELSTRRVEEEYLQSLEKELGEKNGKVELLIDQTRELEGALSNFKLTEEFLIVQLDKTKAIVLNLKLLEQALNQKISRMLIESASKDQLPRLSVCHCQQSSPLKGDHSQNALFQLSRTSNDSSSSASGY